jgi:nitric oxide reductase activation protein
MSASATRRKASRRRLERAARIRKRQETKVFLLAFLQKKKNLVLFLKKKNQKDFYFWFALTACIGILGQACLNGVLSSPALPGRHPLLPATPDWVSFRT